MTDVTPKTTTPNKKGLSGRTLAAVIMGTPLVLMALATFMYVAGWNTPEGRVNHGLLLTPVVPITALFVADTPEVTSEKWQLILRVGSKCDADCEAWIVTLRQLHVTLGKNESRVERLYISDQPVPKTVDTVGFYRTVTGQLTDIQTLTNRAPMGNTSIFVSDPLGNMMLYYTQDTNPKDIMEDVKKLLKLSSVG